MAIESMDQLMGHNRLGASWEGFALECACRALEKRDEELYFWRTHTGAEVDLFWQRGGRNWAVECKFADAPRLTRSMRSASAELELEHLWVVYPGRVCYRIDERITALPLTEVPAILGTDGS